MIKRLATYVSAGLLCALVPACGASIPNTAVPPAAGTALGEDRPSTDFSHGTYAQLSKSFSPDAVYTRLVKAREFRLPGKDLAVASIVVGPDKNLWFTAIRHLGTMTNSGRLLHYRLLKESQSIPGALTNRPDGYIWANAAERLMPKCRCPKCRCTPPPEMDSDRQSWTPYQLFKLSTGMHVNTIFLPSNTFLMPTNLARIGSTLYTGITTISEKNGSDVIADDVDSVNEEGKVTPLFTIGGKSSYNEPPDLIRTIATPDKKLWFYDHRGELHGCRLDGHCTFTRLGNPQLYVESLTGTLTEYSPADQNVYVCNALASSIFKVSLTGRKAGRYTNYEIGRGFCALLYYHNAIWVSLNGDSQVRPMLGRLTPDGRFSLISLPFHGGYEVGAMTEGPDGHLWYVRGREVGEILSRL